MTEAMAPNWRDSFPPWQKITSPEAKISYVHNLAREAGLPVATVVYIPNFVLRYDVPGRRHDGSINGRQRVRWFTRRCATVVTNAILGTLILTFGLIVGELSIEGFSSYRGKVRGSAKSPSVRFADASVTDHGRSKNGPRWLLWSPTVAILATVADGNAVPVLREMWVGRGAEMPQINLATRRLRWADESEVSFKDDVIFKRLN